MNLLERVVSRLMYGKPDYSIQRGDVVTTAHWRGLPVRVVDVNWALRAAAVRLASGHIAVWPVGNLKKVAP